MTLLTGHILQLQISIGLELLVCIEGKGRLAERLVPW
jgi:hypothetical protein